MLSKLVEAFWVLIGVLALIGLGISAVVNVIMLLNQ